MRNIPRRDSHPLPFGRTGTGRYGMRGTAASSIRICEPVRFTDGEFVLYPEMHPEGISNFSIG